MGAPSPLSFLLLLLAAAAALPSLAAASRGRKLLPGAFKPIGDVNDPHIRAVGQFAVLEHNLQQPGAAQLVFSRVDSGQQQVVAGFIYDIVLEALPGAAVAGGDPGDLYEAVVYEHASAGNDVFELISFRPKFAMPPTAN